MRFSYKGIALLAALCGALYGCNEPFEPTIRLAVDANLVELPAKEGVTRVMVYSTGKWSLSLDSESGGAWARIDRASGRENGDFVFEYDANGGLSRKATIRIGSGDRLCEVVMFQAAGITDPTLTVTPGSVALLGEGCPVEMTLSSNLGPDLERVQHEVSYGEDSGEGWITDVALDDESLRFTVTDNTTGAMRFATVTLWVTDGNGARYETRATVTQSAEALKLTMTPAEETHAAAAYGETFKQAFECNIPAIYGGLTLVCDYLTGAEGWLTDYKIDREAGLLSVKVPANPAAPRSARIALRYDDGRGRTITTDYVTLTQEKCDIGGLEGDQMEGEKDDNEW